MPAAERVIYIATRGSALALAQTHLVLAECRRRFPTYAFETRIIKTTGDRLQTAALTESGKSLPKGLFTKELEVALLNREADLAVHSLKDLPTDLPDGLKLAAVSQRADARDVLISRAGRDATAARVTLAMLPAGATVGTSSTRRQAQLLGQRPDLRVVDLRGNVGTRLLKLAGQPELTAIILAAAGLARLGFQIEPDGRLSGDCVPEGLCAAVLEPGEMLPCVGQGALAIETRAEPDELIARFCAALDHAPTHQCALAERAFLRAMGGGCLSPSAAYAEIRAGEIWLRAIHRGHERMHRAEGTCRPEEAELLGEKLALKLKEAEV